MRPEDGENADENEESGDDDDDDDDEDDGDGDDDAAEGGCFFRLIPLGIGLSFICDQRRLEKDCRKRKLASSA